MSCLRQQIYYNKPGKATNLSDKNCQLHIWEGGGHCEVFVLSKLKSFNVSRDPGDGWRRSDSGETREGTKASKTILGKDALLPYQKEK